MHNKKVTTDPQLHIAAEMDDDEGVYMLLDKGADVNAIDRDGRTPLHLAAENGHAKIVDALLKKGAYARPSDYHSVKPMRLAKKGRHWAVVKLLEEADSQNLYPLVDAIKGGIHIER